MVPLELETVLTETSFCLLLLIPVFFTYDIPVPGTLIWAVVPVGPKVTPTPRLPIDVLIPFSQSSDEHLELF